MKLSTVSTLYKSSLFIDEFYERVSSSSRQLVGNEYEIILVNDGSPDDSLDQAIRLTKEDRHVIVIDLSRNFGHHKAMMAGLTYSRGDSVFLIDCDLEESPEWLENFSTVMRTNNADVVFGVQISRKGNLFERWSGKIYYYLFNFLTNIEHPQNITTARLMSRRYVDALLQFREREMVISCLWVIAGFKQYALPVVKYSNKTSTYNLIKKFNHATNAITSFSELPLRFIFFIGLTILIGAIVYAGYLVFLKLTLPIPMDGWTSVMVSIWILGGMIISFIGVIGIYLSKIFMETKQRPPFIVREIYGQYDPPSN